MPEHAPPPRAFARTCAWLALLTTGVAAAYAALGVLAVSGSMPGAASTAGTVLAATVMTALGVAGVARVLHRGAGVAIGEAGPALATIDPGPDPMRLAGEIRAINSGYQRIAREIARAERDRALMLAGISHDLRTPLARLRLEAEMSVTGAQARRHIAEDIEQLDRLVDQFIAYARHAEPVLGDVALRPVAERAAAAFDTRVAVDLDVPAALSVWADAVELERILLNLLQNAERYARPADGGPAQVRLEARAERASVLLRVRDHGPGVPEDQLDRLATPFFRGDRARTSASGAGLGLAIVQRTVGLLGGSMRLTNAPDGGLCVEINLRPATKAAEGR
jgi:two-component system osmolarity sensor histidine kinase EnvZ